MFLTATVTKWQDSKYSSHRVSPRDNGTRQFIINTSYIHDITANGTGSKFYLTTRRLDRKEDSAYLEITQSVADIRTAGDTPVGKMITLPVYRNNNPNRATDSIVINTESLIYADRYNASPRDLSWVMIEENAFKVREGLALVDLSIEDILAETSTLRDYDGNGYTTVTIGAQEWIVENFIVKTYSDGTAIPNITGNAAWQADTTGAYCYYDNDEANFDYIGLLYNWYAVDNASGLAYLERGGVEEVGWRVPTYADWITLRTQAGGVLLAGGKLKEVGTVHWDAPNLATDDYGFKWISGGNRYIDMWVADGFSNQGVFGDYWTSTDEAFWMATAYGFYAMNNSTDLAITESLKLTGQNIRLVRDV